MGLYDELAQKLGYDPIRGPRTPMVRIETTFHRLKPGMVIQLDDGPYQVNRVTPSGARCFPITRRSVTVTNVFGASRTFEGRSGAPVSISANSEVPILSFDDTFVPPPSTYAPRGEAVAIDAPLTVVRIPAPQVSAPTKSGGDLNPVMYDLQVAAARLVSILTAGVTVSAKCITPETLITSGGLFKKVGDVEVGDILAGTDSAGVVL